MISPHAEVIAHHAPRRPISLSPVYVALPVEPANPTDLLSEFQDEIVWLEDYHVAWDAVLGQPAWKHSPGLVAGLSSGRIQLCTRERADELNAAFIACHHSADEYLKGCLDARWRTIASQLATAIPERRQKATAHAWQAVVEFAQGRGVVPNVARRMPLGDSQTGRGELNAVEAGQVADNKQNECTGVYSSGMLDAYPALPWSQLFDFPNDVPVGTTLRIRLPGDYVTTDGPEVIDDQA